MMKGRRIGGVVEDQKTLKYEIGVSQFCLMDLPTAVLHEILFRLPINSIIKVKFVCRALYKLLSDPHFALNYTKISAFATLVGTRNFCKDMFTFYNLELLEISDSYGCIRTTFKPKIPGVSGFDLVGECNGLLCLSVRKWRTDVVYICNPIMGECMALPECKKERGEAEYGFGFCTSTNNYKVMRIVFTPFPENKVEIFTIGIDETWRCLVNLTIQFSWFYGNNFIALNDVFHWFLVGNGSSGIFTFDLGEEKVGRLSRPHGLELNNSYMRLKSINNELCLVDCTDPCVIVLWKMKEYGVAESWTKDIILDTSFTSDLLRRRSRFPETILPNGDILFSSQSGDHLISCNPTNRKVTQTRVRSYRRINYAPSFLSLKEALIGGMRVP